MLTTDYTSKLLDLQDVQIEKVENLEEKQRIYIKLERKVVNCPCCHEEASKIHDYRTQVIKDCEAFGRPVELVLRKRRYVCSACGKRFAEPNAFVPKYRRMTSRLMEQVIEKLSDERSFTSVAKETGLSVTTVIRIFDHVQYPSMSVSFSRTKFHHKFFPSVTSIANSTVEFTLGIHFIKKNLIILQKPIAILRDV